MDSAQVAETAGSGEDVVMADSSIVGGPMSNAATVGDEADAVAPCRDDGPPGMDDAEETGGGEVSQAYSGDEEHRGRKWSPGAPASSRFNARGGGVSGTFGGNAGRAQPFFRTNTSSARPFSGTPQFEQNWNGPPPSGNPFAPRNNANSNGSGHLQHTQQQQQHQQASTASSIAGNDHNIATGQQPQPLAQQTELWVETKAGDDKSYYYHALTRETTWTRPEGPNVRIMSQTDVEVMTAKSQQQQQQQKLAEEKVVGKDATPSGKVAGTVETADGNAAKAPGEQQQQQQQLQHPSQLAAHFGGPPPSHFGGNATTPAAGGPYGMPPPGYGGNPGANAPWQPMPWQQQQHNSHHQHHHHMQSHASGEAPAKSLIVKPGVIEPAVIARAAEWSEHRAPDGRPYYYHAVRGESVWDKPQAIRDLEQARMAAHAGTTPQPTIQLPSGPVMTAMQINATPVLAPHQHQHQIHQITAAQAAAAAAAAVAMFHTDPQVAFAAAQAQAQAQVLKAQQQAAAAAAAASSATATDDPEAEKRRKDEVAAVRKKRDDDEKSKQTGAAPAAPSKPVDKSRPISSTAIAGTPWCVVWTGDGRVFFFNPSTRTSVWERPEDLLGRADVDKAIATTPEQLLGTGGVASMTPAGDPGAESSKPTGGGFARSAIIESVTLGGYVSDTAGGASASVDRRRQDSGSDAEAGVSSPKKAKMDSISAVVASTNVSKDIDKDAVVEAEQRAARERGLVPLEIRVKSFKEMLKEKEVSAFSTWEKELHKIVFDPRYLLLTSRERKQVFEKYVKERAEEERREKRNKMRQKRDDFRALMEAAHLHGKSSFSDFAQKNGKDDRFKGIEKMREREGLFNEYIVDVRRREKDEKQQKKEQVRKDFVAMLRDHPQIDRHCRWQDVKKRVDTDPRYRAVENSMQREDYFIEFCKLLKDERRKAKEKERERKEKKEREKREKERERTVAREKERKTEGSGKAKDGDREKEGKSDGTGGDAGAASAAKDKDTKSADTQTNGKGKDKEAKRRDSRSTTKSKDTDDAKAATNASAEGGNVGSNKPAADNNGDANTVADVDYAEKKHVESHEDGERAQSSSDEDDTANDRGNGGVVTTVSSDDDDQHASDLDTDARAERDERAEAERRERHDRERQQRAQHSIKERERAVQLQLAGHLRDRDKEREHHKRDEAQRHFGALLADLVRNADLTWKEVKKQLRKDHRWELVEQLERDDRERIFNDHIDQLARKKRDKFREMLEELQQPQRVGLSTAFRDVKRHIRDDPRYLKYNSSEKCEREFRDYIKDKTAEAKAAFRELLLECKLITHKSWDAVQENGQHLREIEEILKMDKRFLVLEHIAADRTQMLMNHLEDLHKRGPPPPPTASESTRRK